MDDKLIYKFSDLIFNQSQYIASVGIAEALAPLLFFFSLCINYVQAFIDSKAGSPKFYDASEFKRTLITMIMIPFAPAIIFLIFQVGDIAASFFEISSADRIKNYKSIFIKANELDFSFLFIDFTAAMGLFSLFFLGLSLLIKGAVVIFTGFLKGFFLIVSPLALAFSILPFLKEQFIKLVKLCLNISFVMLSLNILDMMFFKALDATNKEVMALDSNSYAIFVGIVSFTICILYILCMWATSVYVGDPASSAVLTTATTVATATVMALTQAMKSMGGAGGGSNPVKDGGDLAKQIAETAVDGNKK